MDKYPVSLFHFNKQNVFTTEIKCEEMGGVSGNEEKFPIIGTAFRIITFT